MARSFVYGVDFNHDKPEPDWARLWASGTRIVGMKVSQGGGISNKYADPSYLGRLMRCTPFGFLRFAYHFVNNDKALDQANWFIQHALTIPKNAGVDVSGVALAIDFESNPTPGDTTASGSVCLSVLEIVEYLTGITPMLYTNASHLNQFTDSIQRRLARYYGWMASYQDVTTIPTHWTARTIGDPVPRRGSVIMQQFTNGVDGPLPHDIAGFPGGSYIDGNRIEDSMAVVSSLWAAMSRSVPEQPPVLIDSASKFYIKQWGDN